MWITWWSRWSHEEMRSASTDRKSSWVTHLMCQCWPPKGQLPKVDGGQWTKRDGGCLVSTPASTLGRPLEASPVSQVCSANMGWAELPWMNQEQNKSPGLCQLSAGGTSPGTSQDSGSSPGHLTPTKEGPWGGNSLFCSLFLYSLSLFLLSLFCSLHSLSL